MSQVVKKWRTQPCKKNEEYFNELLHKIVWEQKLFCSWGFWFCPCTMLFVMKCNKVFSKHLLLEASRAKWTSTGQSCSLICNTCMSKSDPEHTRKLDACRCSNRLTDAILFNSKNTWSNFFTERSKAQRYLKSNTPLIDMQDAFSQRLWTDSNNAYLKTSEKSCKLKIEFEKETHTHSLTSFPITLKSPSFAAFLSFCLL